MEIDKDMNSSAEVWIWLCCVYEYRNRRMCQSRRVFPLVKVEDEIVHHLMVEDEIVLHLMVEEEIDHHPMIEDETVLPIIIEDTNFIHWLILLCSQQSKECKLTKY